MSVFAGQPSKTNAQYRRDLGKQKQQLKAEFEEEYVGYRNADVELNANQLLENIHHQQVQNDIPLSKSLTTTNGLGACSLDVEMETGTGKTYVYIKTMFEMNKRFGWSKFIVVVPSIAIREGVYKSFIMLEERKEYENDKKAKLEEIRRKVYNEYIDALQNMINVGNRDNFLPLQASTNKLLLFAGPKLSDLVNRHYYDIVQRTLQGNPLTLEEHTRYQTDIFNAMREELGVSTEKLDKVSMVRVGF